MKKIIFLIIIGAIAAGIYLLYQKPGTDNLITPRPIDFINFPSKENPAKYFMTLKAVIVSLPSHPDKKENIDNIKNIIENSLKDDIDLKLIVFGEASLGLYNGGDKYQRNNAETIPGSFTAMLADYSLRYNIHIASGMIELKEGKLYNSLVVVDPLGKVCAVHRKMLLNTIDEANGITRADPNYQVITIDRFKFGLSISGDTNDKWLFEKYKNENIDALISSVTTEAVPWISKWLNFWPYSRAYNAWILAANRSGKEGEQEYNGLIFISSPGGYLNYTENPEKNKLVAVIGQ